VPRSKNEYSQNTIPPLGPLTLF